MPGTRRTRSAARLAEAHASAQAQRDPTLIPLPSLKEQDVAARASAARKKRDKLIADVPKAEQAVRASSLVVTGLEEELKAKRAQDAKQVGAMQAKHAQQLQAMRAQHAELDVAMKKQLKDAQAKHAKLEVAAKRKKTAAVTQRQKLDALDGEHMRMVLERHGNDYSTMAGGGLCLRALAHLGSEELLGRMCVGLAWRRHSKVVLKERGDMKTIMMHGVEDSDLMGKFVEDGEAHGFPRYKMCHKPEGVPFFLFRWTDGRWMVGLEGSISKGSGYCYIRSRTTDARLPLNLSWEKRTSIFGAWLLAEALTTTDIIPPPPQSIVMQGHTGKGAHLMGVYDLEKKKKAHGMPLYKSRHTPVKGGKHAFLYRDINGIWAVAKEEDIAKNARLIKSTTKGALLPLGLAWKWFTGTKGKWRMDAALTTRTSL